MRRNGFTLLEALVALTIAGLIAIIAIPALNETLQRSRLESATRKIVHDLQAARSQAITTGWEYRIVGFDNSHGSQGNRYRMIARRRSSVAWPEDGDDPMRSTTQFAGQWIDVGSSFPGVTLNNSTTRFVLTFDSRGSAPKANAAFNPLKLVGQTGDQKSLTVSVVGGIKVQ